MIRESILFRPITIVVLVVFLFQIIYPTAAFALTGGPSQPETQSFTPAGVTDLVDPFSGDFSYNIPLMDVGGYPIGLSYSSGISMEQEASWVGLGWNINPGVISRNVRGIPDDFKGDEVVKEMNIKANRTFGVGASQTIELFGFDLKKKEGTDTNKDSTQFQVNLNVGFGAKYNTYSGVALDIQVGPSIGAGKASKSKFTGGLGVDLSLGNSGISVSPNVSFSLSVDKAEQRAGNINTKIGSSFNTRTGLQAVSFSSGLSYSKKFKGGKKRSVNIKGKSMSSGFLSFSTPTYTPTISNSYKNRNFSFSAAIGGVFYGADGQPLRVNAYYSDQVLSEDKVESPSFGYLFLQNAEGNKQAVLDFNREKDNAYSKEIKNLAITNATYDIFSVSGEGIGGSYRLYRNDVGTVYDNTSKNTTNGMSIAGPEFSSGGVVKGGLNLAVNTSYTSTHKWEDGNSTAEILKFRKNKISENYESVYFKKSGEKNVISDVEFFNKYGDFEAISFDLEDKTSWLAAKKSFTDTRGRVHQLSSASNSNLNTKRQARNEAIIHYSASEADQYGVFKKIRDYGYNQFNLDNEDKSYQTSSEISRYETSNLKFTTARKAHHLSEINVFSADGRRYVYSDPIYNFIKQEVTFATEEGGGELVGYNSQDNSKNNKNGTDHYYNKVTTPAYPTAFLLSAIVSSDFLEIDGVEGPSDEDLGSYTKFNYTKLPTYNWRTPVDENMASLNEGFKTKNNKAGSDNKANYVYGEKEVKYLHSIETKTHVAEFELENRNDGAGVKGESGGVNGSVSQLKRLKEIRLFSKEDLLKSPTASPIKTVHFEYKDNYDLCADVKNNPVSGQGKLTLEKVYFTYGDSKRGQLSPYVFTYGSNTGYVTNSNDRWGTYQPNSGTPDNTEFPYTSQQFVNGKYEADINAAAWNLSEIKLPSGGLIQVEYEADDYAFVQNRKAMQMFKIDGFSAGASGAPDNYLYGNDSDPLNYQMKQFLKIGIPSNYPKPIVNGVEVEFQPLDFLRTNGGLIEEMYFKMLVNVENELLHNTDQREYVFGYAEIDYSYPPTISNNQLVIKLKEAEGYNPISFATFNLMKRNFPEVVYQQHRPGEPALESVLNVLLGSIRALKDLAIGINNSLKTRAIGKKISLDKSWVRLNNPNGFKKGGGHRVKKVVIDDQWSQMAKNNNADSQYGQEYDYTMQDEYGQTISSGVAAYEPILGNDENPFRQPRFYDVKKLLVPDEEFYSEEPMGESSFPGASVGYRKVSITNLTHENVQNKKSGKTVKEFYTAYDFPTILKEIAIKVAKRKPLAILKLLNISNKDYVSTSQGYSVELNDMHGKQKAEWVYQENDPAPFSGIEYKYKQLSNNRIASRELVVDKSGVISEKYLGVEMDLVNDVRQSYSSTISASGNINNDLFVVPAVIPIPVNVFALWPKYSKEVTRYSSIVSNKVVKRHGLLDETIYYSQKSIVGKTKNLLRDAESGEVLLTQTENEFGDALYSFSYPAYWAYDDMGPVYKTMDAAVRLSESNKVNAYLKQGDQVLIENRSPQIVAWVAKLIGSSTRLIDSKGIPVPTIPSSDILRVINPINTNQQAQTVGQVVTKKNPVVDVDGNGTPDKLIFENVLQASAMEYTEQAAVFCNCGPARAGVPINPYTKGVKGLWKPWREFNYLTQRTQTRVNNDVNTRSDGEYAEFTPFWRPNPVVGRDWEPNYNQWVYTAEAATFNPYGKELESKDALGRYSSALFGYNHSLPTAVAKNARYQQIAFDGFEDYGTEDCEEDHFSFEQIIQNQNLSNQAHTGNRSIKVSPSTGGTESNGKYVLRKVLIECEK